jgi:transcriptional regulator with XRE-family HTH domain
MSKKKNAANQIDAHVGSRVRSRRVLLGLSQEKLGGALGLTFQQIQKYERGANRIGASRLFDLSRALDVPVSYFFDAISPEIVPARPGTIEAKPASTRKNMLEPIFCRTGKPPNWFGLIMPSPMARYAAAPSSSSGYWASGSEPRVWMAPLLKADRLGRGARARSAVALNH